MKVLFLIFFGQLSGHPPVHLQNTRFLMIIISCISVYNIILVRSYFASSMPKISG